MTHSKVWIPARNDEYIVAVVEWFEDHNGVIQLQRVWPEGQEWAASPAESLSFEQRVAICQEIRS